MWFDKLEVGDSITLDGGVFEPTKKILGRGAFGRVVQYSLQEGRDRKDIAVK